VLVDQARAMALARGVIVNGLAIENEVGDLADYYRRNVQAGPESFVMEAKDYEDFAEAMHRKLLREIEYRPRITLRDINSTSSALSHYASTSQISMEFRKRRRP
jgi:hypothetical protein